ncbi:MAG: lysophospholipid acyltransferase family protein [Chloroflexi bacterium]|nr:lysophospholipid acyltransferase family protein [Chloroflexota bacterium]
MTVENDITYLPPAGETIVPQLGEHVPRRGGPLARSFARLTMRLFGWKIEGTVPNTDKMLIIGAPHTSNWDWILVMFTAYALGVRISWMAKHTLFKKPFGGIMRWLGGVAVDRRAKNGTVDQAISSFKEREKLVLCITPEGTRGKVREWRRGFYHIAQGADVPVVVAAFDYGRKSVRFGPTFKPSGDLEADLPIIKSFYDGVVARHQQHSFTTKAPA